MRSRQRPQKKTNAGKATTAEATILPTENHDNEDALEVFSSDDSEQIAKIFIDFILPRDKNILIEKLKETVAIRRYDLDTDRVIFEKILPLFLVDPTLASFVQIYFFCCVA